jgi:hypothetical protein
MKETDFHKAMLALKQIKNIKKYSEIINKLENE